MSGGVILPWLLKLAIFKGVLPFACELRGQDCLSVSPQCKMAVRGIWLANYDRRLDGAGFCRRW